MNTLSTRLKEVRTQKGLSQQELAKAAEVHYTNVGRYERGEANPSSAILNRIAQVLEVSSDFLINGTLEDKANVNISDEKLLIQFKKIEKMPESKKQLLMEFLDGFIFKTTVQHLAS